MATVKNLEIAAQCWCDEETEHLEMIPSLAEAFAKRLDEAYERGFKEGAAAKQIDIDIANGTF